jgi:hypothetical protein
MLLLPYAPPLKNIRLYSVSLHQREGKKDAVCESLAKVGLKKDLVVQIHDSISKSNVNCVGFSE